MMYCNYRHTFLVTVVYRPKWIFFLTPLKNNVNLSNIFFIKMIFFIMWLFLLCQISNIYLFFIKLYKYMIFENFFLFFRRLFQLKKYVFLTFTNLSSVFVYNIGLLLQKCKVAKISNLISNLFLTLKRR